MPLGIKFWCDGKFVSVQCQHSATVFCADYSHLSSIHLIVMPTPASPATGRGRTAAGATPNVASSGTTGARVTRLRAAKVTTSAVPMLSAKKSGILAKSKEGLRKVSDRMKENQKEKERTKIKASPSVESSVSSESLQVGRMTGAGREADG